ncbi:aminotransferase class IV family protein [Streptomyces cremeus]|uniref:Aminotransferase class IV family protein n=1 Tax=Streptomyces cremeus TaxID=66881 RepID=A0ABV5PNY4_STRCM
MMTLNGRPVSADDLLPLALVNMGHFTTMRVDADGRVRGLSRHLERLVKDCRIVWGAELDRERVRDYARQCLDGRSGPCTVRVTVYDPGVDLGRPADADHPRILVSVRGAGEFPTTPLRVMSVPYERDLPEVKHVGLFGSLHARGMAQTAGFDDALFVGRDGFVSEGSTWNVGFVDDSGTVIWPQAPVLPGVTMALLQRHHDHRVADVSLTAAKAAVAAFATNTSIGVRPVAAVDDVELPGEEEVLRLLRESYLAIPGEAL